VAGTDGRKVDDTGKGGGGGGGGGAIFDPIESSSKGLREVVGQMDGSLLQNDGDIVMRIITKVIDYANR